MRQYVDFAGLKILMTDEAEAHLRNSHPQDVTYIDLVGDVLGKPDLVLPDPRPNVVRYYGRVDSSGKLLRVVVKRLPEVAYIVTVFSTYRAR
ncbi:MAG: hypothetical protein FJ319_02760 [SAR202 cluster bacterium]|nr:hypothetical protein [SAR202 cluster bacterium]